MRRVVFTVFTALILLACQIASTATPVISPIETSALMETPLPTTTATQLPTPTVAPTATISPDVLKEQASPICEKAFSASVETGVLTAPFAVMKKTTYADAPTWELFHQLPHLGSLSASDVRTLLCISETRARTGTYTDGSAAYQLSWNVRAVSWPEGKVIAQNSLIGSSPPRVKQFGSGAGEGAIPYKKFAAWIFDQVSHPDFVYFEGAVTSLAISPDDKLAAYGTAIANLIVDNSYQAKIILFNPSDLQTISTLEGHKGMVTALAFSPDGKILASSGYDLSVKLWDVATGKLMRQINTADPANSLMFSPDGTKLATASNRELALIDPLSMQALQSIPDANGQELAFSPDGNTLLVASSMDIKVIDPNAGTITLTIPDPVTLVPTMSVLANGGVEVTYASPDFVEGFALSPNGTQIVTYTNIRSLELVPGAENIRLATWDAKTGEYLSEVEFAGGLIRAMKYSPDGSLLAIGNGDELWIWDTATWQVKEKLTGHIGDIADLVFTADGTKIFSGGGDGTIRVWSLEQ